MTGRVTLTVEEGIADVRLARADRMNAIDPAMFEAIGAAIDALGARTDVRCVLLSGEGKGFCAGLDMASMARGGSGMSLIATIRAASCRSTSPGAGGNYRCR